MLILLFSFLQAFGYDTRSFYITGGRYPYHPIQRPLSTTTHVLFVPFYKNDEREIKKEKERGFWNRAGDSMRDMFNGVSILKITIVITVLFMAIAVGYQIRKSEEQSNYVRLPTAS